MFAKSTKNQVYISKANDRVQKNGCNAILNKRIHSMINTLEEKETKNMMTNLPLVHNAKYFITHNLATKYGIVNGSEVTLHSIITKDYKLISKSSNDSAEIILDEMPICLLLKKCQNSDTKSSFLDLSSDIIPLFPREEQFTVNPKCHQLGTKSVKVKRVQFPLTPAYACTAHKAQGKTLNKAIIDLGQPPSGKLDASYAYVSLSRAKSLQDIVILRPFSINILNKKHSDDYWLELNRLFKLENNQIF